MGFKTGQRISFRPPIGEILYGVYKTTLERDYGTQYWMHFDGQPNSRYTMFPDYIFPDPYQPYDHDLGEIG